MAETCLAVKMSIESSILEKYMYLRFVQITRAQNRVIFDFGVDNCVLSIGAYSVNFLGPTGDHAFRRATPKSIARFMTSKKSARVYCACVS